MPNLRNGENPSPHTENRTTTDVDAGPPVALDSGIYRLLENRRRRYLLYCLLDHDGEVSLSRAVDTVAAWETDCSVEDVRSTDRRCVYSALRRRHIPRLETEDVVAYDEDAGTVSFGLDAEKATRWLTPDEGTRWSKYYLGLAAVSSVFVLADFLAEFPSLLPDGGTHATIAMLFLGLTAVAVYDNNRETDHGR